MTEAILFDDDEKYSVESIFYWVRSITKKAKELSHQQNATQPFTIPNKNKSLYIKKIETYIFALQEGTFTEEFWFSNTFLDHINIDEVKKLRGLPESEIKKAIEESVFLYLTTRNNPNEYDFPGRRNRKIDFATFLYEFNEATGIQGISHFLQYHNKKLKPKNDRVMSERMLRVLYEKDLSKMYHMIYNNYEDFSKEEKLRVTKSILSLCRWWKRNVSNLVAVYKGKIRILFPKGIESFIEYYFKMYVQERHFNHPIAIYPGKKHWEEFCNWIFEYYQIDLETKSIRKKNGAKNISKEEIERRMEAE